MDRLLFLSIIDNLNADLRYSLSIRDFNYKYIYFFDFFFLIFLIMLKIGFPMSTAKNRFQIFNLHPKKHVNLKKRKTWSKNEYAINQYPIYLSLYYIVSLWFSKFNYGRSKDYLLYHRTCKRDFLCCWPSLNYYLK